MESLEEKYLKQRQWFVDRIGCIVYRRPLKCTCDTCQNGNKGVLIYDYDHACYLNDVSGEMGIKYYDSVEDVKLI